MAPTFEYPHYFLDRLFALRSIVDVVQNQAGDDHVEGAVLERQLPRVAALDLYAVGDAFDPSVLVGGFRVVAGLVFALPDIYPERSSGPQALGRPDEQEPPATADIQDGLVPAPRDAIQQPVALA